MIMTLDDHDEQGRILDSKRQQSRFDDRGET